MLSFIEKMREKPKSVRRKFAFFVSLGFVMVLLGFWIITFPERVKEMTTKPDTTTEKSPFASLVEGVRGGVAAVSAAFHAKPSEVMQSDVSSTTAATPGNSDSPASPGSPGQVIITDPEL